jgi:hypothetical protein
VYRAVTHLFACRYVVDGSAHEPLGTSMVFRTAETEVMPKRPNSTRRAGANVDLDVRQAAILSIETVKRMLVDLLMQLRAVEVKW